MATAEGVDLTPQFSKTQKGVTGSRPASAVLGQLYLDTTLAAAGQPIWWNGAEWVDSAGTAA